MEKLTLTVAEAAEVMGVSTTTMYRLVHIKGFPAFKPCGKILISRKLLDDWVARQAMKGMQELQEMELQYFEALKKA